MYDSSERSDLRDGEEPPPPSTPTWNSIPVTHRNLSHGVGGVGDVGLEVYTGDLHIWD